MNGVNFPKLYVCTRTHVHTPLYRYSRKLVETVPYENESKLRKRNKWYNMWLSFVLICLRSQIAFSISALTLLWVLQMQRKKPNTYSTTGTEKYWLPSFPCSRGPWPRLHGWVHHAVFWQRRGMKHVLYCGYGPGSHDGGSKVNLLARTWPRYQLAFSVSGSRGSPPSDLHCGVQCTCFFFGSTFCFSWSW